MEDILTNPLIIAAVIGIISMIFGKKSKEENKNSQNRNKPQHVQTASPQKKQSEDAPAPIPNRMEQVRREAEERRRETEEIWKGWNVILLQLNKKQYTQNKKCSRLIKTLWYRESS